MGNDSNKAGIGRRRLLLAGTVLPLLSVAAHAQQLSGSPAAGSRVMAAPTDTVATLQARLNAVPAGGTLAFPAGSTFDFNGRTLRGKPGITLLADGPVTINRAAGPGTGGAFDFGGLSDWTVRGGQPGQGFVFNGGLVNAEGASRCAVGNCVFNRQPGNALNGAAIRMTGASFMLVINNDFNGVQGTSLGTYNWDNVTIDGNRFTDCFNPVSLGQGNDTSRGRNISLVRNIVSGMTRSGVEMTGSGEGIEGYLSNLLIDSNWFVDISAAAATVQYGTGPVSIVTRRQVGSRITNNFFRVGPYLVVPYTEAIEFDTKAAAGEISGNLIVDFTHGITLYNLGANVWGNRLFNTGGASPRDTVLTARPADPPRPARVAW